MSMSADASQETHHAVLTVVQEQKKVFEKMLQEHSLTLAKVVREEMRSMRPFLKFEVAEVAELDEEGKEARWSENENVVTHHTTSMRHPALARPSSRVIAPEFSQRVDKYNTISEKLKYLMENTRRASFDTSQDSQCSLSTKAELLITSRCWSMVVSSLIALNAIFVGVSVQPIDGGDPLRNTAFSLIEFGFTFIFFVELVIRMVAERCKFVTGENRGWNLLDSALVGISLVEPVAVLTGGSGVDGISAARLIRLVRLARVLRVIRVVKYFSQLRIMIMGITTSARPLGFALLLLLMINYICAVALMEVVSEYISSSSQDDIHAIRLQHYFGGIVKSMYTLYACITNGYAWADLGEHLLAVSPLVWGCFIAYISFGTLCVMNIITGVFVDNAKLNKQMDNEQVMLEDLEARRNLLNEIRTVFVQTDKTGTGRITIRDFEEQCKNPRVVTLMSRVGLNMISADPRSVFKLFDSDMDGDLTIDEFAFGLEKLQMESRAFDMLSVVYMQNQMKMMMRSVSDMMVEVHDHVLQPRRWVLDFDTAEADTYAQENGQSISL